MTISTDGRFRYLPPCILCVRMIQLLWIILYPFRNNIADISNILSAGGCYELRMGNAGGN